MPPSRWSLLAVAPLTVRGPGVYKVEALKEAPPEALARRSAGPGRQGYRVIDDQGKPYRGPLAPQGGPRRRGRRGPEGGRPLPVPREGELLGAVRYHGRGVRLPRPGRSPPGVYTLRYGLQPVNGDHLGVSTYRDYALLVPAAMDKALDPVPQTGWRQSAEAAGTNHPAVLMMLPRRRPTAPVGRR